MPTFQFVVRGDEVHQQADAAEFTDLAAAQAEAVEFAAAVLSDLQAAFWNKGEVQIDIVDETGAPRCTLTMTGSTASAGVEPS